MVVFTAAEAEARSRRFQALEKAPGFRESPIIDLRPEQRRRRRRRRSIKEQVRRRKKKSKIIRILTSPKTTLALGATLGALIAGPVAIGRGLLSVGRFVVPKTLGGAVRTALLGSTAVGILLSSPKARAFAKARLTDPFGPGRVIGGIIEDPSSVLPSGVAAGAPGGQQSFFDKLKDILKRGGPLAAATALGVGLVPVGRAALARFRERRAAAPLIPTGVPPTALLPSIPSLTPTTQPLGAVQKPIEEKELIAAAPVAMPSIKITNKPQINISFRKSRRFINQQIFVKG